jgi:glutathione S-transferase
MSLTLYFHPLASFCWKVLIGLYENETPFTPVIVDLGDAEAREAFFAVWPLGKFPVLRDDARGATVPETTVILDYLDQTYPGPVRFTPTDPDLAWRARLWDRVFDNYVMASMQKVVADRIRPADQKDPYGVAQARAQLAAGYDLIERELGQGPWWLGEDFGLIDCAAMPALFYADKVQPLGADHPATAAYLARLIARPSAARVLAEAEPYFKMFPAN